MVDWNGILKWSTLYHDSNKENLNQFKPLSQDDRKFLEEAMDDYTYGDVRKLKQICENMQKPELGTPEDEENRIIDMENLENHVEALDMSQTFYNIGGFPILINTMLNSQYKQVQIKALRIFGSMNQNNAQIQEKSLQLNSFQLFNLIQNTQDIKIKETAFSTLSQLIRGENLEAKRQFISAEGVEFIVYLIQNYQQTIRIRTKALTLLKDLVYYDQKLHQTYSNLEKFANTNQNNQQDSSQLNLQKNNKISYDKNEELQTINFLEKNQKFQNIVKKTLKNINFYDKNWEILQDMSDENVDSRSFFYEIMKIVYQSGDKIWEEGQQQQRVQELKSSFLKLIKINKETDGLNKYELNQLQELLQALK